MGILSWLLKEKHDDDFPTADVLEEHVSKPPLPDRPEPQRDEREPDRSQTHELNFDDIAQRFDIYCTQDRASQDQIAASLAKLQQSLAENANLTSLVQQLRNQVQKLHGTIMGQRNELSNLQHVNKQLKAKPKSHSGQIQGVDGTGHKLYANLLAEYEKLQAYTLFINEKARDMQFELELLKCAGASDNTQARGNCHYVDEMQLTPQPFVVVLIDGDAYAWARDVFKSPAVRAPGALAAIRLKNEVMKHIMDSNDIPDSARVMTRVFVNGSGRQNNSQRRQSFKGTQTDLLAAFRMQFTEAIPLFDFVDVGHGKERADEKIRENFHLHLSNPYCHRVFLAACTDNGFARMLEQYQYHTAAYEKIVLVSLGYVESEIARLGFKAVVWPSVFVKKEAAAPNEIRLNQMMAEERARREMEAHHRRLGLKGVKNERAAAMVKETVQCRWDGKVMIGGQTGGLAARIMAARQTSGIQLAVRGSDEQQGRDEELD